MFTSTGLHAWKSDVYPDLKTLVQQWVNGSRANYGFLLEREQGHTGETWYRTRHTSVSGERPQLVVTYTPPPTGTLTVTITPADARNSGAQWKLTTGPDTSYHNSGYTLTDLQTGSYTLYFKDIAGWTRPPSHNTTVTVGVGANLISAGYGFGLVAPTGVSASDGEYSDRVRIEWTVTPGATAYEVWRHTSNSSGSASKVGNPLSSPYDDTTVVAGMTYYYWVKAKNAGGTSGFSSSESGYATLLPPVHTPTFNPNGGAFSGSSVNVTITCATAGATIRYTSGSGTAPGADPTTSSTVVPTTGIVNVLVPGWLKAKAWKDGTASGVKSATYSRTTYTVSYKANGATSGTVPAPQTKTHDVPLALAANSGNLAKSGCIFAGWNTAADGSGMGYAAGGIYSPQGIYNLNASVELYAKWMAGSSISTSQRIYFTYDGSSYWAMIYDYTSGYQENCSPGFIAYNSEQTFAHGLWEVQVVYVYNVAVGRYTEAMAIRDIVL